MLGPGEGVDGGVNLVIMGGVGKNAELVEVVGKPGGIFEQVNKAVFDSGGLAMKSHDLIAFWLDSADMAETGFL